MQRDGPRGENVVASAHLDGHASLVAVRDGITNTVAERVLDTDNADERELARDFLVRDLDLY